jgi:hypothetical protein
MKTFKCLECGVEKRWSHSTTNKYCSNACQGKHKWKTETIPRIELGEGKDYITLRKYLIEKRGECCEVCGLGSVYNNKPLVLQVDHINGDSDNNLPKNIRLLCPNCHSQTETFGNGGKGSRYKKTAKRNRYLQKYKAGD